MHQRSSAQQHSSSRAALLLLACLLAATFCTYASAQTPGTALSGTAKGSSNSPGSSDDTSSPPTFAWPEKIAQRCWLPGTIPQLNMTVMAILDAKAASDAWTQNPDLLFDGFWTNVINRDSLEEATVRLHYIRTALASRNLHHAYLPGKLTGNLESASQVPCGPATRTTRTIDGTCNYPEDPLTGAIGTRFGRNVPMSAVQPDMANLLNPNPLLVSSKLLHRRPGTDNSKVPFLNMLAGAWVQFMIHDWFVHSPGDNSNPISVPFPAEHSLARVASTMVVGSTQPDTTRTPEEAAASLAPTSRNMVTHWWDGSQVYGSDAAKSASLREGVGGRMKLTAAGLLPLGPRGFGDAGVSDNWWLGLEFVHTLMANEHNAIAAKLAAAYQQMTDQELFDKARMINAGVMAKIHTLEWTPAILPNKNLAAAMRSNWAGAISMLSPMEAEAVNGLADTFFPHDKDGVFGFRKGPRIDWGTKFSMTEEFTAVYRMHMLLPEKFTMRGADGSSKEEVQTRATTLAGARTMMEKHSLLDLAATFGSTLPGTLTLHNYPSFMTNIILPGNAGALDLAAVDIIRDRERGVPRYNQFRRLLQLKPLSSIDDITADPADRAALKSVYGGDIELVDLMPGVLAEDRRPDCFGFGETQFQVFVLMASRRLAADRFFTTDYNAASYTQVGLDWIEAASLRSVLLRHVPGLEGSAVKIPPIAFNPWTLPTPTNSAP